MNLHAYKVLPIDQIRPYPNNPNVHSTAQIKQLRAAIREFGFTTPVLIDEDGMLLAGHGRRAAALAEGYTELPTVTVSGLNDVQKRKLVIADNQLPKGAQWDMEILSSELRKIVADSDEIDLSSIGFTAGEIKDLTKAFDPNVQQGRLDVKATVTCPGCGQTFERP